MGQNKLLLEFGGETVIQRVVRLASRAGFDQVLVVLGHDADRLAGPLRDLSCRTIVNPDFQQGIHTSLRAGVAAVPATVDAAMVILGDMPLVRTDMFDTLMGRYRSGSAPLVVSRYGGVNAPPTLYDRSLFDELVGADGEGCGRHVVKRHRDAALFVDWPEDRLTDLDVPDDVDRVAALVQAAEEVRHRAG
jgi:molybdenum cofactor cytidylyltransferase